MQSINFTNSIKLEVQDLSMLNDGSTTSITTISSMSALGGPPLASTSIINPKKSFSKPATNSDANSVEKIIEFPMRIEQAKSYQQQQYIDVCGSTINHNNNTVVANADLNFPSSKSSHEQFQLSSVYPSVTSLTAEKSKTYSKPPNVSIER